MWVQGYPLTGAEIDALNEAESARIWEELNAPDEYEKQMKEAALDFTAAVNLIDKAEDELSAAVSDLWDTPLQKVADDLLERLMDFRYELQDLAKLYARGEME